MRQGQRYIEIGRRIRRRRKELKIKQYELAEQINVSNNHISAIENGREKPSIDLVSKFIALLIERNKTRFNNEHYI